MDMRFIGKPDEQFPGLETGAVYDVIYFEKAYSGEVLAWIDGAFCPYSSFKELLDNWEEA